MTPEEREMAIEKFTAGLTEVEKNDFILELDKAIEEAAAESVKEPTPIETWLKLNEHPFLGVQPTIKSDVHSSDIHTLFSLKTHYTGTIDNSVFSNVPQMAFSIEGVYSDKTHVVESLNEAEQKFLGALPEKTMPKNRELKFQVNKISSEIARATRRGRGNVIVCSEEDEGRTYFFGYNNMKCVVRPYIPEGTFYILYAGANPFDRAGLYNPLLDENMKEVEHRLFNVSNVNLYGFKVVVS